jgi:hypothetical protein
LARCIAFALMESVTILRNIRDLMYHESGATHHVLIVLSVNPIVKYMCAFKVSDNEFNRTEMSFATQATFWFHKCKSGVPKPILVYQNQF